MASCMTPHSFRAPLTCFHVAYPLALPYVLVYADQGVRSTRSWPPPGLSVSQCSFSRPSQWLEVTPTVPNPAL
jgi:hypothetical protein